MSSFFFSDVHLGLGPREEEKQKEDRLLEFLRGILPKTKTLVIVGDLFDFWFEYQTVIPKGFHRTIAALHEFTERGASVHYLVGNHDCWMGDFFSKELNISVHHDPFEVTIDKKRVFFHHGDGLAQNDLGYRLIKPILRNRFNVWLYRWLHPDIGVRLARGSSRTSREYTGHKDYGESEGMQEFARAKIDAGIDIVVMGHRHRPAMAKIGDGVYINLGDWISSNTYAEMKNGTIVLKTWNGSGKRANVKGQ